MSTFAKHNVNNATSTPAQIDRDYEFWDCPLLYLENKYQIALDLLNTCAKQNLNDSASFPLRVDKEGPFLIIFEKRLSIL